MNDNLERAVGRIEGKIDAFLMRMDGVDSRIETLDARLDNLEKSHAATRAVLGVIAFVLPLIIPMLLKHFNLG